MLESDRGGALTPARLPKHLLAIPQAIAICGHRIATHSSGEGGNRRRAERVHQRQREKRSRHCGSRAGSLGSEGFGRHRTRAHYPRLEWNNQAPTTIGQARKSEITEKSFQRGERLEPGKLIEFLARERARFGIAALHHESIGRTHREGGQSALK